MALYLHEDAKELLAGKTLVVIGDSVERSVYKDLVCLLQENRYLTDQELRKKGEESFIGDELVYGGVKGEMKNSIDYRESRYYKADNEACCRYYFVTICYGDYVEEVLQELSCEPTDVIVMNSLLWDVHRHGKKGIEQYEQNLEKLVAALRRLLPDCLFIWLTTPPVHIKSKGGFLMRPGTDMVKINEVKFCNEIAREVFTNANNVDRRFRIVDLDAVFKYFEHHRATDGVHWNERAHRRMSNMILEEVSKAFNKTVPRIIGRYDSMWDEGNRPQQNEYQNFHDPHQSQNWGEEYNDHDMSWGQHHQGPPHHGYENGWDGYDHGPMPPHHGPPHGFPPYGMPYGPPLPLPPALCPDLDDLGQARSLVEYQEECQRKRKRDGENNETSVPEKKYRFGVTPRKNDPRKQEEEKGPNVTIIEDKDGKMKKLVDLGDGVTCHVEMSEKEIKNYKDKLEKERLEKLKKEKEERERKEKQAKQLEEEKRKKEAEAKAKEAEEKEKAAGKLKSIDVSKLPLVSEVPDDNTKEGEADKKPKESKGGLSKIASKMLSFIKNPIDTIKGNDKKKSPTTEKASSTTASSSTVTSPAASTTAKTPAATVSSKNSSPPTTTTTNETAASTVTQSTPSTSETTKPETSSPGKESQRNTLSDTKPAVNSEIENTLKSLDDMKPKIVPPADEKPKVLESVKTKQDVSKAPVNSLVEKLRERSTNPTKATTSENFSSTAPSEPVDHLALLSSLSNPFSKAKNKLPPPPTPPISKPTQDDSLLDDADDTDTEADDSLLEEKPANPLKRKLQQSQPNAKPAKLAKTNKVSPKLPTVAKATATATTPLKKKKKSKHPGETKEERKIRRAAKKERKEKLKAEKEAKKNQGEVLQTISTVTGNVTGGNMDANDNPQWNLPFVNDGPVAPRARSATWAPSYYPTYSNQQRQQQNVVRPSPQQPVVQQPTQHALPQPVLYNNTPAVVQQQIQLPTTPQQPVLQQQKSQQLYIDEYGQTYTLEEETYVVGPSGQLQTVQQQAATNATYLQQQQQLVQTQQIAYQGPHQIRYL
ncbi:proteoglycan 4-like [Clytia hemisphaerica]|uniref:Uncharacterized protein n=1 Tax=Clytia hemisphaerica TaxID=252671 RepID=A0A7M5XBF9_9CNID